MNNYELFHLVFREIPQGHRSNLGRDSAFNLMVSPKGRRYANDAVKLNIFRVDNTINPVFRRINRTFLAIHCPKRFQLQSLTETCFSVSPLTHT
jgi:hypothetical protein